MRRSIFRHLTSRLSSPAKAPKYGAQLTEQTCGSGRSGSAAVPRLEPASSLKWRRRGKNQSRCFLPGRESRRQEALLTEEEILHVEAGAV